MSRVKDFQQFFMSRLFQHGGTNDILDYKYAGGDGKGTHHYAKFHKFYFDNVVPKRFPFVPKYPTYQSHCICDASITEQCYLVNVKTKILIVVGNCCIRTYVPEEATKKCTECLKEKGRLYEHLNYICKDCREEIKKKEKEKIKYEQHLKYLEYLKKEEEELKKQREQELRQKMIERYDWTFKTKFGTYTYRQLIENPKNYNLVTWLMTKYDNRPKYMEDFFNYFLEFDDDFNVQGLKTTLT